MIGNKFSEDIMGAVNAGMSAILVNSKLTPEEESYIEKENLDVQVISNIRDLENIL